MIQIYNNMFFLNFYFLLFFIILYFKWPLGLTEDRRPMLLFVVVSMLMIGNDGGWGGGNSAINKLSETGPWLGHFNLISIRI